MTGIARVWNFQGIGQYGRDEFECMTSDIDICDLGLDLRHVAADALTALAIRRMMGVLLQGRSMRSIIGARGMTGDTKLVQSHRLSQIRIVPGAVNIMAVVAGDSTRIHQALHEIIPLHPVLVRGTVAVMCKGGRPKSVLLEFPVVTQVQAHAESDGPVVVFAVDGIRFGLALGMTLNARIVRSNAVEF